ncbi:hypothetical protein HDU98_011072 [Podochytrium sp. JEL0797]|nr:hypothetical protein HDU98_011072 [Podochytrium sp. JEL0797]
MLRGSPRALSATSFARRILLARSVTTPLAQRHRATNALGIPATSSGSKGRTNATDLLTTMSQFILIASAGVFVYSTLYPQHVSAQLEKYKETLTGRRRQNMIDFMSTERKYALGDLTGVFGDSNSNAGAFKQSLMFADQVYHDEVADDARKMLFQPPILRFGIITGPAGSGKSRLMRTLAHEQPYFAFLSFGLTSSTKSIVEELSEEIGYDFDDWTERMLQGYFFKNTPATTPPNQLDKLSFLLDEFEEACWDLKFDPSTARTGKRPVLVFDDLDSLDLTDKDIAKSVRMLFNAANKWAREDTALVCFTCSDSFLDTLVSSNLVRQDVVSTAQVYRVGDLSHPSATRFLEDRLGISTHGYTPQPPSPVLLKDISKIKSLIGTKIFDLLRVCEELAKKDGAPDETSIHPHLNEVLERELQAAQDTVAHQLSTISEVVGSKKMNRVVEFLDKLSALNKNHAGAQQKVRENGWNFSDAEGSQVWEAARKNGLDEALRLLKEREVLSSRGMFASDLARNGYRRYRHLSPIVFNPTANKSWWPWG